MAWRSLGVRGLRLGSITPGKVGYVIACLAAAALLAAALDQQQ